jgi:hypothetical protein
MPASHRPRPTRLALGGLLALAAGCRSLATPPSGPGPVAAPDDEDAVIGCAASGCADADARVDVTYLGAGGFLVRHRGAVLLTAPFYTNPPLHDVALPGGLRRLVRRAHPLRADTARVERLLPPAADSAALLLVGHAHYDHLLDVPYVARRRSVRARIVGSPTVRHTLLGDSALRAAPGRLVALAGDDVGRADRPGRWVYGADSAFRVMALAADHAPTLALFGRGPLFAGGVVDRPLAALPTRADGWKAGEPLAFLVDVLEPGPAPPPAAGPRVRLRLYYQDAPSTPPLGFPPAATLAERPVDVALLCGATSTHVPHTPERLLAALRPAYVVVGHWESFFRSPLRAPVRNPATDVGHLAGTLARTLPPGAGWRMPLPGTTLHFDLRRPAGDARPTPP